MCPCVCGHMLLLPDDDDDDDDGDGNGGFEETGQCSQLQLIFGVLYLLSCLGEQSNLRHTRARIFQK